MSTGLTSLILQVAKTDESSAHGRRTERISRLSHDGLLAAPSGLSNENGARFVRHAIYAVFKLAEAALPRAVAKHSKWEHFYNLSRPPGAFNGKAPYEVLRKRL